MEVIKVKDIYTEAGYIKADRDFKDMIISALRYAIPRHTYIVDMTCEYIKNNAELILDNRVISVMLRDINDHLDYCKASWDDGIATTWQCDYDTLDDLRRFLEDYDVEKTS
jgi:hypothetical protein